MGKSRQHFGGLLFPLKLGGVGTCTPDLLGKDGGVPCLWPVGLSLSAASMGGDSTFQTYEVGFYVCSRNHHIPFNYAARLCLF